MSKPDIRQTISIATIQYIQQLFCVYADNFFAMFIDDKINKNLYLFAMRIAGTIKQN